LEGVFGVFLSEKTIDGEAGEKFIERNDVHARCEDHAALGNIVDDFEKAAQCADENPADFDVKTKVVSGKIIHFVQIVHGQKIGLGPGCLHGGLSKCVQGADRVFEIIGIRIVKKIIAVTAAIVVK
jgi:hypothetical protein